VLIGPATVRAWVLLALASRVLVDERAGLESDAMRRRRGTLYDALILTLDPPPRARARRPRVRCASWET